MEAFKLLNIFKDNLIKVVLHDVNLPWKLLDLCLMFGVVVLLKFISLGWLTYLHLKSLFLFLEILSLLLKFLALILHLVNDLLLSIIQIFVYQILLGLSFFHLLQFQF